MKYEKDPLRNPAPRPSTEDAYVAWAMKGYIADFGLSAEDAFDLARRDWEIHQWAQSFKPVPVKQSTKRDPFNHPLERKWNDPAAIPNRKLVKKSRKSRLAAVPGVGNPLPPTKVKDFRGMEFNTFKEMCEHWGVDPDAVYARVTRGWSLEKALRTKVASKTKEMVDHNGKHYSSIKAMCCAYGIKTATWSNRRAAGWDMRRALETPEGSNGIPARDPLGRTFPSLSEMARAWGIPPGVFSLRFARGCSLEKALTTPVNKHRKENK